MTEPSRLCRYWNMSFEPYFNTIFRMSRKGFLSINSLKISPVRNPFMAEKLGRASQSFSEAVLKQATLDLADADYYLKTGQAGAEVLENVVICLCQPAR